MKVDRLLSIEGFSHFVDTADLGDSPRRFTFDADQDQRRALARFAGVDGIEALRVEGDVATDGRARRVRLNIRFTARVIQSCVVTLDPVASCIDERFSLVYTPDAVADAVDAVEIVVEDDDPPEPLTDRLIDVAAVVGEHLVLAIDPYPRREGAMVPSKYRASPQSASEPRENSFSVLQKLKEGR